ncbi:FAS1 domain-containing protein [Endogone sp. FLAS-F59071]|nr:FAS1 domain-containing protein [Endogone sp. FLAS-F59071]|eukprot:RUS14589.1 FAS1 domain-containing protein [Endogone sp. FLAS-F59071]
MLFKKAVIFSLVAGAFAQSNTIVDVLQASGQNTKLLALLTDSSTYAPIVTLLSGNGTFTVFAPNDDAFDKANLTTGADYTSYHILGSVIPSVALANGSNFADTLLTNTTYDKFGNGQGLPLDVVKDSTGVTVHFGLGSSTVVKADNNATNGVVHIIDTILMPPVAPSATAEAANLTGVVDALTTAGLVSAVDGAMGVTIFAPSNGAFQALVASVGNLSSIPLSTLQNILKYHVVSGVYYSTNIIALKEPTDVTTLLGPTVHVLFNGTNVLVNNSTVVLADILVDNGVVHVIDSVLMPPTSSSSSATGASSASSTSTPTSLAVHNQASFVTAAALAVVFCVLLL